MFGASGAEFVTGLVLHRGSGPRIKSSEEDAERRMLGGRRKAAPQGYFRRNTIEAL